MPFIRSNLLGGVTAPIMYDKLGMEVSSGIFIIVFSLLASACVRADLLSASRRQKQGQLSRKGVKYELLSP